MNRNSTLYIGMSSSFLSLLRYGLNLAILVIKVVQVHEFYFIDLMRITGLSGLTELLGITGRFEMYRTSVMWK